MKNFLGSAHRNRHPHKSWTAKGPALHVHLIYGVLFTPEQFKASEISPPIWELSPPQREEYESDLDYANDLRLYADRVINFQKGIK